MMEFKGTQGDWRVLESRDVHAAVVAPGVATVCMDVEPHDARLIAAAPELLAACQSLPSFDIDDPDAADFKDNAGKFMKSMRLARAAIAKALGEDRE